MCTLVLRGVGRQRHGWLLNLPTTRLDGDGEIGGANVDGKYVGHDQLNEDDPCQLDWVVPR